MSLQLFLFHNIILHKKRRKHLEKMNQMILSRKRIRERPFRRWQDDVSEDMKNEMTLRKMIVLEHDGEDWPSKMWRWSLHRRNVRKKILMKEVP